MKWDWKTYTAVEKVKVFRRIQKVPVQMPVQSQVFSLFSVNF